ncbi:hypothetical protein ASPWEDRAFT_596719 [Aspergillus wentii DTO 134E9]|uniref:Uncharacterized protein n=1 Tax=Aspergillus wentii DTO 134E9 TaxID=1073089 RepID=A0A1L9RDD8_ASPWE|nr:uncharacterized protein ASPWEDRAFT_596719 [Aspergillus wentii DTO 134E9]OJJ32877.1 hypothetical protein ASPWEDRAFT_596719 [Aspergillus wentii DTO 134E9]
MKQHRCGSRFGDEPIQDRYRFGKPCVSVPVHLRAVVVIAGENLILFLRHLDMRYPRPTCERNYDSEWNSHLLDNDHLRYGFFTICNERSGYRAVAMPPGPSRADISQVPLKSMYQADAESKPFISGASSSFSRKWLDIQRNDPGPDTNFEKNDRSTQSLGPDSSPWFVVSENETLTTSFVPR